MIGQLLTINEQLISVIDASDASSKAFTTNLTTAIHALTIVVTTMKDENDKRD